MCKGLGRCWLADEWKNVFLENICLKVENHSDESNEQYNDVTDVLM